MKRALLMAAVGALLAGSQVAAAEEPSRVTVGSPDASGFPDVSSTVVVADRAGLPITGLTAPDFTVIEDGKTVPVTAVEPVTSLPANLSVILVLDTSGSMAGKPLEQSVAALSGFVDRLGPDAQVGGVSLGGTCTVDPGSGLSGDKSLVKEFFAGAAAGGDTPLYDATLAAIQQSLAAPEGRRMVVVLTDGEDTCSKVTFNTVVDAAVRNAVPLMVVGLGPDLRADVLQNLARLTGGQYFTAEDSTRLEGIYTDLTDRLRTQYAVRYRSAQLADRKEHTLMVRVRSGSVEASGESRFTPPVIEPKLQLSVSSGQKIAEPVSVEITSSTPVQLARADLFLDDTLLQSISGSALAYTLDPAGLSPGGHTLRVHAWDAVGGEAETSIPIEFVETGLFGRIPFWAVLALALALPVLALVGAFALGGHRRLRCPTCRRTLQSSWTTCPYCSQPEQAAVAPAAGLAAEAPLSPTLKESTNGHARRLTSIGPALPTSAAAPIRGRTTQLLNVAEPPGAWLVITEGEQRGMRFSIGADETTIGRDGSSDVVLDDPGASRQHARIRRMPSGYQLTDLDTTNGTRVNGKAVHRQTLGSGDTIEIGSTTLGFVALPDAGREPGAH